MQNSKLKVLMIATDPRIGEPESAVSKRLKEYAGFIGELHVVLLCDSKRGLKIAQLSPNLWVYPTNSAFKYLRPIHAARLGKRLVIEKKFVRGSSLITTQDPFECGWAGLQVKKKWRIPMEAQLHTDPYSPHFTGTINKLRKIISKRVLRHADLVRVVTKNLEEKLRPHTKARIYTLPIYVDRGRMENKDRSFDLHDKFKWQFIILSVARLTEEKNLSFALEILQGVVRAYPNTGLVIVGSGPEESKLKSHSKKLGLERNVAFEGWQEDVSPYYKSANLFLQTSLFEGYGLALIEAGISGLPVVTTPVGIAQEITAGKDALVYPSGNRELFISGIIDLIENNLKRENLILNMRSTLETKLLPKEAYIEELTHKWLETAGRIS